MRTKQIIDHHYHLCTADVICNWYRLLLLQKCYWNQCHYSFMIFSWLDLYHVLMIFSSPARLFKSFQLKKRKIQEFKNFYNHYYCRLTVREGCVDILFYLKILSVLDKSDANRNTKHQSYLSYLRILTKW